MKFNLWGERVIENVKCKIEDGEKNRRWEVEK